MRNKNYYIHLVLFDVVSQKELIDTSSVTAVVLVCTATESKFY